MKRRMLFVLLLASLLVFPVFSDVASADVYPSPDEFAKAMTVMADCLASTFVNCCIGDYPALPSTSVSMDTELNLPNRIAFFLADPAVFQETLKKYAVPEEGAFSTLVSMFLKQKVDPLVTAAYMSIASRGYQHNNYLISGSFYFSYSENLDYSRLEELFLTRLHTDDEITVSLDVNIFGDKISRYVKLTGDISIYTNEQNQIIAELADGFTLNGYDVSGTMFKF